MAPTGTLKKKKGILVMKNAFKVFTLAVLTASIACIPASLRAAEASKDKAAEAPKPENKPKQMPFRGKVSAVDKSTKTITLEGKEKGRTFHITSESKITKEGKPSVLDEVTVGESVGGMAKESAAGKWEVVTLNVGPKAGKPKQDEKKGEKK